MIGVSRKQVKRDAVPGLLPSHGDLRIVQTGGRPRTSTVARLDQLVIVAPHTPPASLWRLFTPLAPLRSVHRRLGKDARDRPLRARLPTGTGVTVGLLPAPGPGGHGPADRPNQFRLLQFAGQLIGDALADEPRSIGLMVHGLTDEQAERVVRALLAAIGARAVPGPAFRREARPPALRTVQVLGLAARLDLARTQAETEAANLVRWLGALPANKLTATSYRTVLSGLARTHGWEYRFLDESALKRMGAGAFLAVAQGSATRDAGIVHLRYRPTGPARPALALVGKGIIFDTGGTNLKQAKDMLDMHHDMAGSAVAVAVLQALTRLRIPLPVDCWLAITENRAGPAAYKQRDVVTASNGTTIEVIHTDAEGRMALADALALAAREKPRLMMDYATLTGACVYALSERYSGVFSNCEPLNPLLVEAGRASGERVWPFPMDDDFDDDLKSKVADVAQCVMAGEADHILAARFLRRFVPDEIPWVHMDLSAVTRKDGLAHVPGGLTGFGVRYTLALLLDHATRLQSLAGDLGLPRQHP